MIGLVLSLENVHFIIPLPVQAPESPKHPSFSKKQLHRMVPGSVDIQAGNIPPRFPTVSKIYFSTVDKIRLIFPLISTFPYTAGMIKWSPLCTFSPSTVPSPSRTDTARKG